MFENTTWNCWGRAVDCRALTLAFEFYGFDAGQVRLLKEEVLNWVDGLIGSHMRAAWNADGRSVRSIRQASRSLEKAIQEKVEGNTYFEAYLSGEQVKSAADVRRYRKLLERMILPHGQPEPMVSWDFPEYWNTLFQTDKDEALWDNDRNKERILTLFREKGRIDTSACFFSDTNGALRIKPYQNIPDRFWGSFYLNVSAHCLGKSADRAAELFLQQLEKLGTLFPQMNGRIMYQPPTEVPGRSPYMFYFGTYRNSDGSHHGTNQTPDEWYETYYLPGVEWANLISPRAQLHLPSVADEARNQEDIACYELHGGGLILKSPKSILYFDIDDAACMKRVVQDGLYPGGSEFSMRGRGHPRTLPRHDWAIVPVDEEEIVVLRATLAFRSRNYNQNK